MHSRTVSTAHVSHPPSNKSLAQKTSLSLLGGRILGLDIYYNPLYYMDGRTKFQLHRHKYTLTAANITGHQWSVCLFVCPCESYAFLHLCIDHQQI